MKCRIAIACALLALVATHAFAAGINLSWTDCGQSGSLHKTFACTSNTLSGAILIGSFVPPVGATLITGEEIVLDLVSASSTLPAWWQFKNLGTCRQTAFSIDADFTAGPPNCADYWMGQAAGGFTAFDPGLVPGQLNRARVLAVVATAMGFWPADAGVEYGAFKITINGTKTVGVNACGGCLQPVCLVLNEIKLLQPSGLGNFRLQNPESRNYVTWQGGVVTGGCPAATPTRNATWGSVKALYR